ncbi:MAG: ParB/RepB/Spo0J family partition protein [Flavobacteriales bacterium]|nr:ParB/RepB/Spo0J family partition protein [Flavobacteriales bacterium]
MSTKKKGLGRGLSALLDDPATDITTSSANADHSGAGNSPLPARSSSPIGMVPVAQIEANPFQPRTHFSEEALLELAQSIKELGVIQPVTLRKIGYDRYQLISGERRFRASQLAGLIEVPAYVRVANDEAMLEMALVENIQREELDAIEVAISFQRLVDEVKLTQEQLSEKVGKDRTTVTNYLRLLRLPPEIQLGLRQRTIGMGHARALIAIADPAKQVELYERIVSTQLSVRQVEELARAAAVKGPRGASGSAVRPNKDLSKLLAQHFGTRVVVKQNTEGKGRIEIPFKSEDELRRILAVIRD